MADPHGSDPTAAIRAMLDQWLTLSNAVAERTLGVSKLAAGGLGAGAQQSFAETIGRVMTGMNLPNRAEILEIGVQVAALHARFDALEARLDAALPAPPPPPRPARTRKPPA